MSAIRNLSRAWESLWVWNKSVFSMHSKKNGWVKANYLCMDRCLVEGYIPRLYSQLPVQLLGWYMKFATASGGENWSWCRLKNVSCLYFILQPCKYYKIKRQSKIITVQQPKYSLYKKKKTITITLFYKCKLHSN